VATKLRRMIEPSYPSPVGVPPPDQLARLLDRMANPSRPLHEEQKSAALKVMEHAIACLQGGAGVGKTYTLKIVCDLYENIGGRVLLGALAGKAALRLARSTGGMPLHWHGSSANWLSASVSKAPCTIPGGMRLPWQDSRSG